MNGITGVAKETKGKAVARTPHAIRAEEIQSSFAFLLKDHQAEKSDDTSSESGLRSLEEDVETDLSSTPPDSSSGSQSPVSVDSILGKPGSSALGALVPVTAACPAKKGMSPNGVSKTGRFLQQDCEGRNNDRRCRLTSYWLL